MKDSVDVLVAGGGIAGLSAALAFGRAGYRTLCVDPAPADAPADARTTALMAPACVLLRELGLWPELEQQAAALQVMRIVDAGGDKPEIADFDAAEIGSEPFGWNFPNLHLRAVLGAAIAATPQVAFRAGMRVSEVLGREAEALATLSGGGRIAARLVVAADGRNSALRGGAGIAVSTTRYGQDALVFSVSHDHPHDSISTEVHRAGGPFTLVPLPDIAGRPASSVVWMTGAAEARRLQTLDPAAFGAAANARSAGVLGPLDVISGIARFSMIAQIADRLTARRLALVAEAAHVVPPIGAQGLNMSLADIAALVAAAGGADPGREDALDAYARARHGLIRARVAGIDALNRASIAGAPVAQAMRRLGLRAIAGIAPVRRGLMRAGVGPGLL